MDDIFGPLLIVLLVGGIGWVLGVAGFFRAGRALETAAQLLREVTQLRAELAGRPVGEEPARFVPPLELPEPVLDPAPLPTGEAGFEMVGPLPGEDLAAPAAEPVREPGRNWEELLTARWGVWLGAAALLLAAVFLVRYAAEQDLLGPGLRCAAAGVFGIALVAGAEWLQRRSAGPARLADYGPGALAAGGVGAWFAASYMAGIIYGLAPPLLTFGMLAASSLAGLLLSLRFGPLVAAVGVVGAFVTPFLVSDAAPYLPLLFGYFLFVAACALSVVRYTAWAWLGWATTVACAGLLVLSFGGPADQLWGPALFGPAVALLAVGLLPGAALDTELGRLLAYLPVCAVGAAGLLLAVASPVPVAKAGVLLLAAVAVGKGATEARLDWLPWVGAVLFLLLLAVWGLPGWTPTGEAISTEGTVIAVLPGDWTPPVLRPLLATAAGGAIAFFVAGVWGERRRPGGLRWSALAAAVPVVALGILFWRVQGFQTGVSWAAGAVAVAAASTAAASRAGEAARAGTHAAGTHAAGATAALALGCGMLLSAEWLTLALSLFVPVLAVIERSTGLAALRRVALAAAGVVGVRLLLNMAVLDDAEGQPVFFNVLWPAYGVAAVAFGVGARLFRRDREDLVAAVLELGSAAFVAALAVLEVRQWATGGHPARADGSFLELASDVAALSLLSLFALYLRGRTGKPAMGWAAAAGGAVSFVLGAGLVVLNPAFFPADTGAGVVLNPLLLAYLVPAVAALLAVRRRDLPDGPVRGALTGYALLALFTYVTLEVRQAFHPGAVAFADEAATDAELWAWSGAWLLFGIVLMGAGIAARSKPLRLAALGVVALAAAKVFLFDMAGLDGLWRALSFGGLGLVLIGLGAVYRRFVAAPDAEVGAS